MTKLDFCNCFCSYEIDDQEVEVRPYGPCKADTYFGLSGAECVCDYQGHQICETYI